VPAEEISQSQTFMRFCGVWRAGRKSRYLPFGRQKVPSGTAPGKYLLTIAA
jgi:hypothetical protein